MFWVTTDGNMQSQSGIFHLLPLGARVQEKLETLLQKHMDSLGGFHDTSSSSRAPVLTLPQEPHAFLCLPSPRRSSGAGAAA